MLVAFSVWPSGGPGSDSGHDAIAAAVRVVRASGLPNRTDAMFTTIEGEWGEVFDVIHRALRVLRLHPLRAVDAMQLAAALEWGGSPPDGQFGKRRDGHRARRGYDAQ